jgi:menaquinone-dependent protoporphyrinogen oxidase
MSKILILYASQKGSTAEVAQALAAILQGEGHEASLANAEGYREAIHAYDALILGTGIYKGMWLHSLLGLTTRLLPQFQQKPVWGFALCVRVLEPAGEDYARQFYLPYNLLDKLNLQEYRFFAGRLTNLTISEKRTLAERYDGHYHHEHEGDNRDWDEIRAWGKRIARKLEKIQV